MPITKDDVEKIAELARLDLTAREIDSLAGQLSSIIAYFDKLNELDTTSVAPMSHCATASEDSEPALREDVIRPSLGTKSATESAPDAQSGYFRVPKVIGG